MKRLWIALSMVAVAASVSACSDTATAPGKQATTAMMQISAVHWDEVAAADTVAHVSNNNLIMMR